MRSIFRNIFEGFAINRFTSFGSGVQYLLRDLYTTDRAAGAVNGTLAEPTGQTRTVTDGNSKLSITGGNLSFATGGVGAGNPGLWYPSMSLLTGRVLLATVTIGDSVAKNSAMFGWDTSAAGAINNSITFADAVLKITANGATVVNVGVYTDGVAYTLTVIQRSIGGSFMLIKGGAFTNQTMIWNHTSGTIAILPGITVVTGTAGIFTADNIRVPVLTYIPAPLAYDTFTRSDGVLGSTETTGPDAQAIAALAWAFTTGIWTIATNKAVGTPVLGADVIVNGAFAADSDWTKGTGWSIAAGVAAAVTATADLTQTVAPLTAETWYTTVYTVSGFAAGTVQAVVGGISYPTHAANATYTETGRAGTTAFKFTGAGYTGSLDNVSSKVLVTAELFASVLVSTADVFADVAVTLSAALGGLQAGLVLNLDSTSTPQNYILCYLDGRGNCVLEERVAGVTTIKFTTAITYSAGAVLRVIRDGTSCRVFYNNLAVSTVQTMSTNVSQNHGLFSTSASNSLDGVVLWPRGTGSEYAASNSM